MSIASQTTESRQSVNDYLASSEVRPLFVRGDSLEVLANVPRNCVDLCMTSPPYWGHRAYSGGGIGQEDDCASYIENLLAVVAEVKRVLKPTGSFWLNIGDTYQNKGLVGVPWRVALALCDRQGWVLRNSVIWNKVKGGRTTRSINCGTSTKTCFTSSRAIATITTRTLFATNRVRRESSMAR